jgi:H+-transporting ATPase
MDLGWRVLQVTEYGVRGIRCMAVAKTNKEEKWELIGILTFLDPPRPDTKDTIDKSMAFGVDVKMVRSLHFHIPA